MEVQVPFMMTKKDMKLLGIKIALFVFIFVPTKLLAQDWKLFEDKEKAVRSAESQGDYATAYTLCNEIISLPLNVESDRDSRLVAVANAYFCIGHYYLHAHYVSFDISKAIYNFEKSAEFKVPHSKAEMYLSMIYNSDKYKVKDLEKSFNWIKTGAERCAILKYILAEIYEKGYTNFLMNDTVHTDQYGQRIVASNVKLRTNTVLSFPNIKTDKEKAYLLYAEYFEYNTCYIEPLIFDKYDMGVAYMDGIFLKKNHEKAFGFLRRLVPSFEELESESFIQDQERIADALWRLSILYRFGLGTRESDIQADRYMKYAAKFGNFKAIRALEEQ